ncbi:MAG: hypothetical protein LUQ38_04050 [Methanotrichaceae archaeon]|nr:hypothetical protein [Methanotrichaceae archaeon]
MFQLEDTDLCILNALQKTGTLTPVFQVLGHLGIEPGELGDGLELFAGRRLIRVQGLSGTFVPRMNRVEGLGGAFTPGMTLPNGIYNVGLTAEGRQFLTK